MMFSRSLVNLPIAVLLLAGSFTVYAQNGEPVDAAALQAALAERDAVIIDLLNRVQSLERRLAAQDSEQAMPAGAGAPMVEGGSGEIIDELAAERALERGLVQQGARLLRAGQAQLVPTTSYARLERRAPALPAGGLPGETARETDIVDAGLQGRLGLPFNAQLEVNLPYRRIGTTRKMLSGGAVTSTSEASGSGLGNASVGIAARLFEQSAWRPDLLGRFTWLTGSGDAADGGVSLGGDYSGFGLDFNATWRRDPVVFLLGAGYFRYDDDGLQPGDTVNLSAGASLAISPETALTVSLDQRFADDFQVDGRALPGTDQVSTLLNITTSTLIGRGSLLQLSAGIGLTPDAPDYRFGVSLPFDAGFLW